MLRCRLSLFLVAFFTCPAMADEDAKLAAYFKDYLEEFMKSAPLDATRLGEHKYDDRLDDLSPQAREANLARHRNALAKLPKGAYVVNAARGGHVVDADLIEMLDRGHLAGATLDAFHAEPLPDAHPFWSHPLIFMTPHVAADPDPHRGARLILDNLERVQRGERPRFEVDPVAGY